MALGSAVPHGALRGGPWPQVPSLRAPLPFPSLRPVASRSPWTLLSEQRTFFKLEFLAVTPEGMPPSGEGSIEVPGLQCLVSAACWWAAAGGRFLEHGLLTVQSCSGNCLPGVVSTCQGGISTGLLGRLLEPRSQTRGRETIRPD